MAALFRLALAQADVFRDVFIAWAHGKEAIGLVCESSSLNAKFWVHPEVRLAGNYGFDAPTLNELEW